MLRFVLFLASSLCIWSQPTGPRTSMVHNWDCVACETNSMLVGNFGTDRADFEADQDWWVVCTNSNESPNKSNLYSWYISLSC